MSRRTRLGLVAAVGVVGLAGVSGRAATSLVVRPASGSAAAVAAPVPAKYQSLYDQVSADLNEFSSSVAATPKRRGTRAGHTPTAGVELLAANGNRLTALLQPGTMNLVDASLDRFRALGVRGVTLGIKLPMLLSSFSPDARRYADFYATVANHIRARKLAVSVELGSLFCGTVYATCTNPFDGSLQTFVADQVAQARIVIKRVHPNYLTLFAEPDTEAELTGIKALDTPAGAAHTVSDILAKIGPRGHTQVGAGSPTWLPPSFAKAIATTRIDYLDTHIYPVGPQEGANATAIASIAAHAHKPVVVDEVWLYKSANPGAGGGAATADQVFRQDTFSFWEPLDARFLSTAAIWAQKAGAEYVSAFWSWQLFTYLTWTPALDADSYPQLSAAFGQTVTRAVDTRATTPLGRLWAEDLRRPLPR